MNSILLLSLFAVLAVARPPSFSGYASLWSDTSFSDFDSALVFVPDVGYNETLGETVTNVIQILDNGENSEIVSYVSNGQGAYTLAGSVEVTAVPNQNWFTANIGFSGSVLVTVFPDNTGESNEVQVYIPTGSTYKQLSDQTNLNGDFGGLYFVGDVNGDGSDDFVEVQSDDGNNEFIVSIWDESGHAFAPTSDVTIDTAFDGTWLGGQFSGAGVYDLTHITTQNGYLTFEVYSANNPSYNYELIGTTHTVLGTESIMWLTGNVNGDNSTDLIQIINDKGHNGIRAWRSTGKGFAQYSYNITSGFPGALQWLAPDLNGDDITDILQILCEDNSLGVRTYLGLLNGGYENFSYNVLNGPCGFIGFVLDVTNNNFVQFYDNGDYLGAETYGPN